MFYCFNRKVRMWSIQLDFESRTTSQLSEQLEQLANHVGPRQERLEGAQDFLREITAQHETKVKLLVPVRGHR